MREGYLPLINRLSQSVPEMGGEESFDIYFCYCLKIYMFCA